MNLLNGFFSFLFIVELCELFWLWFRSRSLNGVVFCVVNARLLYRFVSWIFQRRILFSVENREKSLQIWLFHKDFGCLLKVFSSSCRMKDLCWKDLEIWVFDEWGFLFRLYLASKYSGVSMIGFNIYLFNLVRGLVELIAIFSKNLFQATINCHKTAKNT